MRLRLLWILLILRMSTGGCCLLEAVAGKLSSIISVLGSEVDALRVFIEGSIDFSDEDYDFIAEGSVEERLVKIKVFLG